MELTAQKGKRRQGKKDQRPRSNLGPTLYREFQPRDPQRLVEILRPHHSYICTGHRCAAMQRHLTCDLEAGTVCGVMVAGLAVPSTLNEFTILRWNSVHGAR